MVKRTNKENRKKRENNENRSHSVVKEESDSHKSKTKSKNVVLPEEEQKSKDQEVIIYDQSKSQNDTIDQNGESVCSLCCEFISPIVPDFGLTIVKCKECKLAFHRRCYGESNINCEKPKPNNKVFSFKCSRCRNKSKNIKCCICQLEFGYIKEDSKENLIHPECALYSNFHEITDYHKMELTPIDDDFLSKLNKLNSSKKCKICRKENGFMIKCFKNDCYEEAHISCICREKVLKNLNSKLADISEDKTKITTFVFKTFIQNLGKIEDEEKREKLDELNKTKGILFCCTGSHCTLKQHCICTSIDHKNIKKTVEINKDQTKKDNNKKEEIDNDNMIACDYCFSWHHYPCLEEEKNMLDGQNQCFLCPSCKQYSITYFFAEKYDMLKEKSERVETKYSSLDQKLKQDSLGIFFVNHLSQKHCNMMDIPFIFAIVLQHIWIEIAEKMLENVCNMSIIESHIESINALPFLGKKI